MFRLVISEAESGAALFISQPFNHFQMRGREVVTEYGRMTVREGLEATIIRTAGAAKYVTGGGITVAQETAEVYSQKECA